MAESNGGHVVVADFHPFLDNSAMLEVRKRKGEAITGDLVTPDLTHAITGATNSPNNLQDMRTGGGSVLQMWASSPSTMRTTGPSPFTTTPVPTPPSSTSTFSGMKNARELPDSDLLNGGSASKRFRMSAPTPGFMDGGDVTMMNNNPFMMTSSKSVGPTMGMHAVDRPTPEEQYQAMKEGSQNMMEVLSISQQNTQECTQTLEESPEMCVMRLVLHPEVDRAITAYQKNDLEQHGLYRIEMHRNSGRVVLGRDRFVNIFDRKTSGIDPIKLSRTHCLVECMADPQTNQSAVFITDKSTNGIRINGVKIEKDRPYKLSDGQKITLLSSRQGNVLLGYIVEDPHVRGAQVSATPIPYQGNVRHAVIGESQNHSQQPRSLQEYTLGVLFSTPLVGKDVHGKYHPISELDVKREYSILKQSLIEASQYAKQPAPSSVTMEGDEGASKTFLYPRQINVSARFANTENFRSIITLGCRALHFSGHGDDKHLYFEDGMGLVHPIPHSSLQELFSAGGNFGESPLRLAFVSACSSAPLAYAFVACGIPHVIGVRINQKIEDYAAIEFTRSFYLALATGKSVGASFKIAQQAVAKSPNIRGPMEVAEKFMLLPENGDHNEIIFPLDTMEANGNKDSELGTLRLKRYPKLWFDDLPAMCQGFCNRAVEVYKICLALMITQSRITRLVTICGEEGIGKTAVAHAVANYVGPRITSEGGVRIFSVADLAQEEMDENIELVRRHVSISNSKCRVLTRLDTMIREHLDKHKRRIELKSQQLLLVLDGCDYLLRSDVRRERFRAFLSNLLTNNASLKIVLTARTSISADGAVAGHGERVYALSRFSAKMSAKMLLSLVSRPIRIEELKRAKKPTSTDKLELIITHPALHATQGIPKRIADLAGKLNQVQMDNIVVDESTLQPMNMD